MDFADAVAEQEIAPNVFMLDTDTEDAQEIAKSLLWYSKRFSPQHSNPDVPRFYDIASLTEKPQLFKRILQQAKQPFYAQCLQVQLVQVLILRVVHIALEQNRT